MEKNILSERELRRYQAQIDMNGIGLEGQEKIKNARVLVIGAGGLGTPAIKSLIAAGVGYLGICDDALLEEEDLGRQSLYNDIDLGKQKAIATKQHLQNRNQFTQIKIHNIRLNNENALNLLLPYDMVVDASNDLSTHGILFTVTEAANKPLVWANISNQVAIAGVKMPGNDATAKEKSIHSFLKQSGTDTQTPLVLVYSVCGNILAGEALKLILQKASPLLTKNLFINLSEYSFSLK